MTEQNETEEQTRERARRLHARAHEVMDLLSKANEPIAQAFRIMYDAAENETDFDNKVASYVIAGKISSVTALMSDLGREVHNPHTWGFASIMDAVMEQVVKSVFEHEQAAKSAGTNGHRKADG